MHTMLPPHFRKYSNFSKILQTLFLSAQVLPLMYILANLDHVWGSKGPKPPKKGHFMDACLVRKTLETFNLATTNAILMKLTTIVHLYQVFHMAKNEGVTQGCKRVQTKNLSE